MSPECLNGPISPTSQCVPPHVRFGFHAYSLFVLEHHFATTADHTNNNTACTDVRSPLPGQEALVTSTTWLPVSYDIYHLVP